MAGLLTAGQLSLRHNRLTLSIELIMLFAIRGCREFRKMNLKTVKFEVILFPLMIYFTVSSNATSAETLADRKFCAAFENRLSNPDLPAPPNDQLEGCTGSERVQMFSANWPEFVSNFREYIDEKGFPVSLYFSFRSMADGKNLDSFLHADIALENAVKFFSRSNDLDRGELYSSLIIDWRNRSIAPLMAKESYRKELLSAYDLKYLKFISYDKPEIVLKCLLMNDPLVWKVQKVIESPRFVECISIMSGDR